MKKYQPSPLYLFTDRVRLTLCILLLTTFFSADWLFAATETVSLDGSWTIRTDPKNEGKSANWQNCKLAETGKTSSIPVPGVIQQVYREFHGVVWYERTFRTPANPHTNGRTILRFWQAEYRADVWLNGKYIGFHEGGESSFEFDVTNAILAKNENNRLTVRVLNADDSPIDGIAMANVPHRNNTNTVTPGCGYSSGGLVDSVELLLTPAVRISDLHLIPDWKTGKITVRAGVINTHTTQQAGRFELMAASVDGGETVRASSIKATLSPGSTPLESRILVPEFKLWNLNDPNLYTVTAQWIPDENIIGPDGVSLASDRRTATCGFRDFRFENGFFRLNGKRIYVKCSHTGSDSPITHRLPLDPDFYRKDIIFSKTMGFNMIRYIAGMPRRFQLDLCDRIGFLVYDECLAGWCFANCPERSKRFAEQTEGMIRRDWNHPSVVIWGLLNETSDVKLVLEAADFLKRVRELDPDRMVFLNSGSFDPFDGRNNKIADFAISRRSQSSIMPAAIKNETDKTFFFDGTDWTAQTFFLHPGDINLEYAALKWTAPTTGTYTINATFTDVVKHGQATVDVHFLKGGKSIWTSCLNLKGNGKKVAHNGKYNFEKGEELLLTVGVGDGIGTGDTTAVDLKIIGPNGTVFDINKDYTSEKNPNGTWSYGWLAPGNQPNPDSFRLFTIGQKKLRYEQIGRFANPGISKWQNELADTHPYKSVPHTAKIIEELRTHSKNDQPVFLSEYGIGSAVDLFRLTRLFEQHNATEAADARHYRDRFDRFMSDWKRWKLDETFYGPEEFFREAIARMAEQRRIGTNAIRANANVIAHSVTGTNDQGISGEGLTTLFRELKPGTIDAMADVFAPLRFCCFVEPIHLFKGGKVRLEAVLVNEDIISPGKYPVRLRVIGPGNKRIFDEVRTLTIPEPPKGKENPITLPFFSQEIAVDGPTGEYRLIAEFEQRAAAAGGTERFFVTDPVDLPNVKGEFIVWGNDIDLLQQLPKLGIKAIPDTRADGTPENLTPDSKIIVGWHSNRKNVPDFNRLKKAVESGANVLFLTAYDAFNVKGDRSALWPLSQKGAFETLPHWLYHKDDWTKRSPAFDGLPCGDVSDYLFYRELIPNFTFNGPELVPDVSIAGAFNTQMGYSAGLSMAIWNIGKGKMIFNTWRIQNNLPDHPIAVHMLRNLLNML